MELAAQLILPKDAERATLVGRAWIPARGAVPGGPSPVAISAAAVYDLSGVVPTSAELVNNRDPVRLVRESIKSGWAKQIGNLADLIANSHADRRDPKQPFLLTPCDLQALRACGVTFVSSMVERVIEEHAKGDPAKAEEI
ncbi:MAG TPA: fumarylacetoacetate hydrolase, partial [Burkholderiales bacterium]|nr:fumarylacetoacetate hydrolase [Burkholderiales bacterium]